MVGFVKWFGKMNYAVFGNIFLYLCKYFALYFKIVEIARLMSVNKISMNIGFFVFVFFFSPKF